ncbi:phasin family protein [Sphingomonas baiyangensis]|uniref:Phasin family protein n=1 Tax=Sphingomonas baiyangensis TaxID=2572576 RepID=A0A4U1L326_9SPHN|nr:phasin family protein [Sphingomonas baiyangensis]TKD50476.1 phasin family protein [Sphingomonas baiyangensis]
MARNPQDAARETVEGAAKAASQAGDEMRETADRMGAAGEAMQDQGAKLGLTMLEQAELNTREAFAAMRAAAQASDLSEVMRIQTDYMRDQGSRSVSQAREIGEIIAGFGRSAMGQFTGRG